MKLIPKSKSRGGWSVDFSFLIEIKNTPAGPPILASAEDIEAIIIVLADRGYLEIEK